MYWNEIFFDFCIYFLSCWGGYFVVIKFFLDFFEEVVVFRGVERRVLGRILVFFGVLLVAVIYILINMK